MLKNIKAGDTTCLKTFTRASIDIQGMYNYSFIQVGLLFVAIVVIIQCTAAPYVGSRITQISEVYGVPCTCWEPYIGSSSRILPHQSQRIRLVIYWRGLNEPSLHVKFQWQAYKNYRATGPRSRRIAEFWVLGVQYRMNYVHAWAIMCIKTSPRASNDILRMYIWMFIQFDLLFAAMVAITVQYSTCGWSRTTLSFGYRENNTCWKISRQEIQPA